MTSRSRIEHDGRLELHSAQQTPGEQVYKFFHGASWGNAQRILREGFRASTEGCLGPGIYVARREKAERFAEEATRHGDGVGG